MPLFEEWAKDDEGLETPRGTVRGYRLGPDIYVISMRGNMERPHSDFIRRYGDRMRQVADGRPLRMFHDWLEMGGYQSQCRRDLTDWLQHRLDWYAEVHLAHRSRIVAMGVNVANVALGGAIRVHTERTSLEQALQRTIAEGRVVAEL